MIIRAWRGKASADRPDAYPEHFRKNVLPELRRVHGFLGASLLKHETKDGIELLVLTRWSSMVAIEGFAGSDVAKAVVEPEAIAALTDYDRTAVHYDVVEDVNG